MSAAMPPPPILAGATRVCACPQFPARRVKRPFPKAEESPTAKPLSIQNGLYALIGRLMFEPATTRVFGDLAAVELDQDGPVGLSLTQARQ